MRAGIALLLAVVSSSCATVPPESSPVTLAVGSTVAAEETGQAFLYKVPATSEEGTEDGGIAAQTWSMLGREDLAAATGHAEYVEAACKKMSGSPIGIAAVADAIAERAVDHRIVIVNESHMRTQTRALTDALLPRLRPQGFTVFAAETFSNAPDRIAPFEQHFASGWPNQSLGYYSREPAFGRMVRTALAQHYRLASYEQTSEQNAPVDSDRNARIAAREEAQARNLMKVLASMKPTEKLFIHVGYSHLNERAVENSDGSSNAWMAARLKDYTSLDPLTINQTECHSDFKHMRLAVVPESSSGLYDIVVDIPLESFARGRVRWRRDANDRLVDIPAELHPTSEPVVIEAFHEGEPFDAVPIDRVYVEPGEDIALSLPPGRYTVRAVRLVED